MFTPISAATMWASVVLPSPGGPNSSTWSSASLRLRAAWMKISNCSRIFTWPTYSARRLGRSARSIASSWRSAGAAEIRRSAGAAALSLSVSIMGVSWPSLQGGSRRAWRAGCDARHAFDSAFSAWRMPSDTPTSSARPFIAASASRSL